MSEWHPLRFGLGWRDDDTRSNVSDRDFLRAPGRILCRFHCSSNDIPTLDMAPIKHILSKILNEPHLGFVKEHGSKLRPRIQRPNYLKKYIIKTVAQTSAVQTTQASAAVILIFDLRSLALA